MIKTHDQKQLSTKHTQTNYLLNEVQKSVIMSILYDNIATVVDKTFESFSENHAHEAINVTYKLLNPTITMGHQEYSNEIEKLLHLISNSDPDSNQRNSAIFPEISDSSIDYNFIDMVNSLCKIADIWHFNALIYKDLTLYKLGGTLSLAELKTREPKELINAMRAIGSNVSEDNFLAKLDSYSLAHLAKLGEKITLKERLPATRAFSDEILNKFFTDFDQLLQNKSLEKEQLKEELDKIVSKLDFTRADNYANNAELPAQDVEKINIFAEGYSMLDEAKWHIFSGKIAGSPQPGGYADGTKDREILAKLQSKKTQEEIEIDDELMANLNFLYEKGVRTIYDLVQKSATRDPELIKHLWENNFNDTTYITEIAGFSMEVEGGKPSFLQFSLISQDALNHLKAGENILINCQDGLGITGSILAAIYIRAFEDHDAARAIEYVREHYNKHAIDSIEQENAIMDFCQYLKDTALENTYSHENKTPSLTFAPETKAMNLRK